MSRDAGNLAIRIPHTSGGEPNSKGKVRPPEYVFPTRVGVNRAAHGVGMATIGVFPTHVGVNRSERIGRTQTASIPHARGGEPTGRLV